MASVINIAQLIIAALLIGTILLQQRGGSGLGGAFGGFSESFQTRRGAERFIFQASIVLTALLIITSLARIIS